MDIQDVNLLTSSDFEHLMEDLTSDTNFSPLNVDQNYGQGKRNGKATLNPPLSEDYGLEERNRRSIDAVAKPINSSMLQNFGQGERDEQKADSLQITVVPTMQDYNRVQEISEAIETAEIVQSTTPVDFLRASFSPSSTLPCRDNYPGHLNFQIFLDSTTAHKKSWVYSTRLGKVFIDMNKTLLVTFQTQKNISGLFVRALPVYSIADYLSVPVQRCALHELYDDPLRQAHPQQGQCLCHNYAFVRHVVRTTHSQARYNYDCESDRHSVLVPLDTPQPGSDLVVVEYFFTCKTSCAHGMNRKPIDVIFTLETEHCEVLGRHVLPVKICSCPKRDKDKEELDATINGGEKLKSGTPGKRRISSTEKQDASKKIKIENEVEVQESTCDGKADNLNQNPLTMNKATVNDANSPENLRLLINSLAAHTVKLQKEISLQREEIALQREEITLQREENNRYRNEVMDLTSKLGGRLEAMFQFIREGRHC